MRATTPRAAAYVTLGSPYRVPLACPRKGGGVHNVCLPGRRIHGLAALLLVSIACAPSAPNPGPAAAGTGGGAAAERPAPGGAAVDSAAGAPGSIVLAPPERLQVAY